MKKQFDNLSLYCNQANGFDNNEFNKLKAELLGVKDFEEFNAYLRKKYDVKTEKNKKIQIGQNKTLQLIFEDKKTVVTYYNSYEQKGNGIIFKNPKYLVKT